MQRSRHIVRVGPVGWFFAVGLAALGLATTGGIIDNGDDKVFIAPALLFSCWAVGRTSLGGVWIDAAGDLVVRDWIRTRRYRADQNLTISYIPYDGFVNTYQDSRAWATLTFSDGANRSRPCRLTVARFATTKRRVDELREAFGLPAGPRRID